MQNGADILDEAETVIAAAGSQADIQLVRRTGAPPLRIRGRKVCEHALGGADADLWIGLWRLARSGFVVHCAVPVSGGARVVAARATGLEAAGEWLEGQCAELLTAPVEGGSDLIAVLHGQHFKWRVERFLQLAGRSMSAWPAKVRDL